MTTTALGANMPGLGYRLMDKFRFLSDSAVGSFGGALLTSGDTLSSAFGNSSMGRASSNIQDNMTELTKKIGSGTMPKTLKDVLQEKIAKAKADAKAKNNKVVAKAGTPIKAKPIRKIANADVEFVNGLADGIKQTKTGADRLALGASALGQYLPDQDTLGTIIRAAQAFGLGALGLQGASSAYGAVKDAIKKETSYKQMFNEFPELNEMPRAQVDKYWNVLNDFAPKLTTNPLVAGQFISNMVNMGYRGIDHNIVGQLAQISGNINQSTGFSDSMRALSGLGTKAYENNYDMLANTPAIPTP